MWRTATRIVETLRAHGHTAYFAGGAVRDLLLDRPKTDVDIATSATPDDVARLFKRTYAIGREFGVILVRLGRHTFEVATFRGESDYDGRHPGHVHFTDAEEDARRRDITINGLFYDPIEKRVLDYVGGQHDLKLKVIRFIGNADERLREDHLRLLRAVRLRNSLDFDYEPTARTAIQKNAPLITRISGERIRDELTKMLIDPSRAASIRDLNELGLLREILPELTALHAVAQPQEFHTEGDAFTHALGSLAALPMRVSPAVAYATLFHDLAKATTAAVTLREHRITFPHHAAESAQLADGILRRLKMDNATRAHITWLIAEHMTIGDVPRMRRAHQHRLLTHPWFPDLLKVCLADIRGTRPMDLRLYRQVVRIWKTDVNAKLLPAPAPLVTGRELIDELGLIPGPIVKRLLAEIHDAQIEGHVTTRDDAINLARRELRT